MLPLSCGQTGFTDRQLALGKRERQGKSHDHGGEKLDGVAWHVDFIRKLKNQPVSGGARDSRDDTQRAAAAAKEHLSDDDGGQTYHEHAAAVVQIGVALLLAEQTAGKGNQSVGKDNTENAGSIGVDRG